MAQPPPPLRDLYPRITAFSTLLSAASKASKGKRYRPEVLAFNACLECPPTMKLAGGQGG